MIDISFKKIIIVSTETVLVAIENQASPEATAAVSNGGTVQPKPINESMASQLVGVVKTALFGE